MKFFTEGLREVINVPPQQRLNAQNEKRIKLNLDMLLTEDNLEGAPKEVLAAFKTIAAVSNGVTSSKIVTEFDHVTIEYRPLKSADVAIEVRDALIRGMSASRPTPKEGSPNDVTLHMTATVPYSKKLWAYLGDNGGATIFVSFAQAQEIIQNEDAPKDSEVVTEDAGAAKKKAKGKAAVN